MKIYGFLPIIFLVFACGKTDVEHAPPRPAGVPPDSVWVGGRDGGVWLKCLKKTNGRFNCQTFSQGDGRIFTEGEYQLWSNSDFDGNEVVQLSVDFFPGESFDFFDGSGIFLKNGTVLVPDGEFITHFEKNSGAIQIFSEGKAKGEPMKFRDLENRQE